MSESPFHGWIYPTQQRISPVVRFLGTVASWLFLAALVAIPWAIPYLLGLKT